MIRRGPRHVLAVGLAVGLAAALTWAVAGGLTGNLALAASTTIGAAGEIGSQQSPDPVTANGVVLQGATGSTHSFVVPAGGGVITQWLHRTGSSSGTLTFKVYRPTGTSNSYRAVAADPRAVTAGSVQSFNVRIPVNAGDVLGLTSSTGVQLAYDGTSSDKVLNASSDPAVGSTANFSTSTTGFVLDVSAVVEPDADGDGYGDQTQDLCPTDASTQGACVDTLLTKKPKHKVHTHSHKAKVKLKFTATVAGSTFQCSVDGAAYAACASPFKGKYKLGKHTVLVRAVKPSGVADPTPATVTFKVKQVR